MGYIGKVSLDYGPALPIGSTLFGVTDTPAATPLKLIRSTTYLGSNFTALIDGITVHILFRYGNTATTNLQLKIGDTVAKTITNPGGTWSWPEGSIVSFTYDGTNWVANDGMVPAAGIVEDTYDPTSSNAISGKGVAEAIAPLVPGGDSAANYSVETSIGGNPTNNKVPTSAAVANYVNDSFGLHSAWIYKGTIGTGGTVTTLPISDYYAGWTYKVNTAGRYAGKDCEVGDLLLATADGNDSSLSVINSHWAVILTNIINPVSGPSSATENHVVTFGTSGLEIKDSGYTIETSVPANAVFTDTHYEDKGTVSTITEITDGNEFTLASIVGGTLNIKKGLAFSLATVSLGIREAT